MERYVLNIMLALLWGFLESPGATLSDVIFGFVLGFFCLYLLSPLFPPTRYFDIVFRGVTFLLFFGRSLVKANLELAYEILTPGWSMHPAFLECDLGPISPAQAVVVAAVVTLLPGTLAVDLTQDGRTLYIHAMYASDPEAVREEVTEIVRQLYGDVNQ